jgi:Anti-sigma-K factor rskA
MIEDHQDELAALGALDLLEGEERTQFCAVLAAGGNPELRRRATELHEAASALAYLAPPVEPPKALKARILASIAGEPSRARLAPIIPFPALAPWALAACFAAVAFGVGALYWSGLSENALLRQEEKLTELELRGARDQLEGERILRGREVADARKEVDSAQEQMTTLQRKLSSEGDLARMKIATLVSMLGNSREAVAVAVWDPGRQQGVLNVSKLPTLAEDKDYQLWLMDPQYPATPAVSGGVFRVDPENGEAKVVFTSGHPMTVARFAVSLERRGGATKREGPVVLLSQ